MVVASQSRARPARVDRRTGAPAGDNPGGGADVVADAAARHRARFPVRLPARRARERTARPCGSGAVGSARRADQRHQPRRHRHPDVAGRAEGTQRSSVPRHDRDESGRASRHPGRGRNGRCTSPRRTAPSSPAATSSWTAASRRPTSTARKRRHHERRPGRRSAYRSAGGASRSWTVRGRRLASPPTSGPCSTRGSAGWPSPEKPSVCRDVQRTPGLDQDRPEQRLVGLENQPTGATFDLLDRPRGLETVAA